MSRTVNLILAVLFVIIGFFIGVLGITVVASGPKNETEWTIGLFSLGSAALLIYGAYKSYAEIKRQANAERTEAQRLKKMFTTSEMETQGSSILKTTPAKQEVVSIENADMPHPEVLAHWIYTATAWRDILQKLAQKTRKEEFYTAFWFPILFAIIFFAHWYIGFFVGIAFGWLYIQLRVYFIKQKFALKAGQKQAEVFISDAYLRINGNFIHYADGRYFLKNLAREQDSKLGEYLHFTIGWVTSKGYPAEMDLYLPIPAGHQHEADLVLEAYKRARS